MDTITTTHELLTCDGSAQPVTVALTPNEHSLIAAAPDLLAAAELGLRIAMGWYENHEGNAADLAEMQPIRAAIAQARGES